MITADFNPGDIVRVHQKIQEVITTAGKTKRSTTTELKTRTQVFEGIVLSRKGRGENKTFTVRKAIDGIAVERIWPLISPNIEKIEVKGKIKEKIRRAKLYHLRRKIS